MRTISVVIGCRNLPRHTEIPIADDEGHLNNENLKSDDRFQRFVVVNASRVGFLMA